MMLAAHCTLQCVATSPTLLRASFLALWPSTLTAMMPPTSMPVCTSNVCSCPASVPYAILMRSTQHATCPSCHCCFLLVLIRLCEAVHTQVTWAVGALHMLVAQQHWTIFYKCAKLQSVQSVQSCGRGLDHFWKQPSCRAHTHLLVAALE